jgi:hypothetical protein
MLLSGAARNGSFNPRAGQQPPQKQQEIPNPIVASDHSTQASQIELLNQQNELLRQYNRELLQVITWSLTFAAVFLIGVLGLIGYFTTRRYDQEKEALKSHLDGQVATAVAQAEARLADKADTIRVTMELNFKELREALHNEAESAAKSTIDPFFGRLQSIAKKVAILEIDFAEQQAKMWENQRVTSNAVRYWRRYTELANNMEYEWMVTRGLDQIQRLLQAGTSPSLTGKDITDLHSFLTSLSAEYDPLVTKIKGLL